MHFLDSIDSIKHRAILMVAYAAGLRVSEATHLKPTDIYSQRMMLRVAIVQPQRSCLAGHRAAAGCREPIESVKHQAAKANPESGLSTSPAWIHTRFGKIAECLAPSGFPSGVLLGGVKVGSHCFSR